MLRSMNASRYGIVAMAVGALAMVVAVSAQEDKVQIKKMHEHLSKVETLDYAVIRGDLDDATAAAKAIAADLSMAGLPPASEKYMNEMRAAANAAAGATDIATAAKAAGTLQAACGNCHAATGHPVKMAADAKVEGAVSTRTRMREHARSIDALAKGLQGPSDDLWNQGAKSMKNARLIKVQLQDAQLSTELNAADAAVQGPCGQGPGRQGPGRPRDGVWRDPRHVRTLPLAARPGLRPPHAQVGAAPPRGPMPARPAQRRNRD